MSFFFMEIEAEMVEIPFDLAILRLFPYIVVRSSDRDNSTLDCEMSVPVGCLV